MAAMRITRWRFAARPMRVSGTGFALACVALCTALGSAPTSALAAGAVQDSTPAAQSNAEPADAALVARIAGQWANQAGVRAQFRQTQTLGALSAPLVSTGTLVFVRDRGVIWQTQTPHRVTYVIGDAAVATIDANGNRSTRGAGKGGMAQVSKMMRAMVGGDLSALYSQFDVAAEGTPAHWRLRLTPNQPQLAQAVKSLQMEGGAFLTTLEIAAANGDTTRIDFSGSERIKALSPAESALFGAR